MGHAQNIDRIGVVNAKADIGLGRSAPVALLGIDDPPSSVKKGFRPIVIGIGAQYDILPGDITADYTGGDAESTRKGHNEAGEFSTVSTDTDKS